MKRIGIFMAIFWVFIFCAPFFKGGALTLLEAGAEEQEGQAQYSKDEDTIVKVKDDDGVVNEMTMREYLYRVVWAEVPESFEVEALKAQAVAARSYTMYRMTVASSHEDADVCTDSTHCQFYKEGNTKDIPDKIKSAVNDTNGVVVLYEKKPVNAVFHAISSGVTEAAKDVWGADIPYLQSRQSAPEQSLSAGYEKKEFSLDDFKSALKKRYNEVIFDGYPAVGEITRTKAGTITEIWLYNIKTTGSEIRSVFGLKSANFTLSITNASAVFESVGYGHGVGMSQYGANLLAKQGKDYKQILTNYYTNIEIGKYLP